MVQDRGRDGNCASDLNGTPWCCLFRSRVAITLHIHAGVDSQVDTPGLHRTNEPHHLRAPPSDAGTSLQHPLGCCNRLGFSPCRRLHREPVLGVATMAKKKKIEKCQRLGAIIGRSLSPLGTIRTISGLEYVAKPLLCE